MALKCMVSLLVVDIAESDVDIRKDLMVYNIFLDMCDLNDQLEEALRVLEEMKNAKLQMDHFSIVPIAKYDKYCLHSHYFLLETTFVVSKRK